MATYHCDVCDVDVKANKRAAHDASAAHLAKVQAAGSGTLGFSSEGTAGFSSEGTAGFSSEGTEGFSSD